MGTKISFCQLFSQFTNRFREYVVAVDNGFTGESGIHGWRYLDYSFWYMLISSENLFDLRRGNSHQQARVIERVKVDDNKVVWLGRSQVPVNKIVD